MAAEEKTSRGENGAARTATAGEPTIKVLGQYVKDLSFENPHAPQSFQTQGPTPKLDVGISVGVNKIADTIHEVTLSVENRLSNEAHVLFHLQLEYAGAFQIENMPDAMLHQVLRVQCPTLLFPFVRRVVSDITRDGGFPSLYLDPVDFAQLYVQEAAKQRAAAQPKS